MDQKFSLARNHKFRSKIDYSSPRLMITYQITFLVDFQIVRMCTFCPDSYSFDQKCIHKANLMRDIEIVPKLFRTKIWTPAYSVPNKLHIGVNLVFSIMDGDHMAKTTKVKERLRESLKLLNFTPDSTKERLLLIFKVNFISNQGYMDQRALGSLF